MLIAEYDYDTYIAVQREEAGRAAFDEGLAEGSRQKALETAKNLLQFGLSVQKIAQATGLTKEDVEAL